MLSKQIESAEKEIDKIFDAIQSMISKEMQREEKEENNGRNGESTKDL